MTRQTENLFISVCVYCHVPHQAKGERLWSTSPYGPTTGWGSRPIAQLCYTCHDNTGGGYGANDVVSTAYSDYSHSYMILNMPALPDGSLADLPNLPYVSEGQLDCTTCHDPHANDPPFLRFEGIDALCKSCHQRENAGNVGSNNVRGSEEITYSLHPTDMVYLDISSNGITGLEDYPERLEVETAEGAWKLGGHRVGWKKGEGEISCQTCHPVHGGWNYILEVLPGPPGTNLTAIENSGGTSSALCQACHTGGDAGEYVGEGTDHPINSNDGSPLTVFPEGWPSGVNGEVTCSSCHDAHGGEPGTSLLRRGGNSTEGWCFSCHGLTDILPPYHHSSVENDEPPFISVITCGDCHGMNSGWTAHNGFEGYKVADLEGELSLCEACHVATDPPALDSAAYYLRTGQIINFSAAVQPSSHGREGGTDSHLINDWDDDSLTNCSVKTTPWPTSGGLSQYGPTGEIVCQSCHSILENAGLVLGDGQEEELTGGWKVNLLLEPYEDNDPGVGVEDPDNVQGPTLSGLCRGCHFSQQEGVNPTFVHNPEAHTVIDYVYPEGLTPHGRQTLTVLTDPKVPNDDSCPEVSSADQTAPPSGIGSPEAPGAFSYPQQNVLDCDSCHRPHRAHSESSIDGVHRILEYTADGAHGTVTCLECHDTENQCGYHQ